MIRLLTRIFWLTPLLFLLLNNNINVYSQEQILDTVALIDTLVFDDPLAIGAEGPEIPLKPLKERKPHSPHKATLMAMALPGWGQLYNDQWWKLPILYGGIGATVYGLTWNMKYYNRYKNAFLDYSGYLDDIAANGENNVDYPDINKWDKLFVAGSTAKVFHNEPSRRTRFQEQLRNKKNYYKRNRDLLYIVSAGIYVLQIIDATVFAHFYDFEIDENLSLRIEPTTGINAFGGGTFGLTLTLNF